MKGTEEIQEPIPEAIGNYDDSKNTEKVGELEVLADQKALEEKELEAEASKQTIHGNPKDLVVRCEEEVRPTSEDSQKLASGGIKDIPDQTLDTQKVQIVQESAIIEVENEPPSEGLKDENETDSKKVEEELSKQSKVEAKEDLHQDMPKDCAEGKEPLENECHKSSKDMAEDGKEAEVEVEDADKPHVSEDIDRQIEVTKKSDVSKEMEPITTELADQEVTVAELHDEKKELEMAEDSQIPDSKVISSTEKSATSVEGTSETKDVDENSKPDVTEIPEQVKDECTSVPEAEANVPETQETKETEECVPPAVDQLDENVTELKGSTEVKKDTSLIVEKFETKDVEETAITETMSVLETDESKVVPKAEPTESESEDLNEMEKSVQQQRDDLKADEVIDDVKPEGMEQVIDDAISNQEKNTEDINEAEDTKKKKYRLRGRSSETAKAHRG
eukprot:TRINITY_DN1148_c0_g1_i1.p1 TRINITY_DN1148_c0_g1~~TRINITY_DN1148_c0_g1_i1.p1  ORF type:complete len:449 (-),score=165.05 TRINITY_DN1148_c0_g1_i1:2-1348(-)